MERGRQIPEKFELSSLRLVGSVGEPINPEAYMWYREVIGGNNCPVVDTWWQTETGMILITPRPGVTAGKPGSAMTPLPGVTAAIYNESGVPVDKGGAGYLVITIVPLFMFATPVFYSPTSLPAPIDFWIYANALTGYVEVMRDIVLFGKLPDWRVYLWTLGTSAVTFWFGYWFFDRYRNVIVDVI